MQNKIVSEFTDEQSAFDFFCREMDELLDFYQKYYASEVGDTPKKFCVAVSGGSDSIALLFLMHNWARQNDVEVFYATVDHKLRKESLEEALFVQTLCKSMEIKHDILPWNSKKGQIKHGKLENLAREARYKLLSDFCTEKSIPILLTGHTWSDQLETFEMRKSHGSSEIGLAGISRIRSLTNEVKLLRPVLHFTKKYLENFLLNKKMTWKNDPMNNSEVFQRVVWRKKIASYDAEKIFKLSDEVIRLGKIRNTIEMRAVAFMKAFCEFSKFGYGAIELDPLLSEEKMIQMEVLRRVIWNVGRKKYANLIDEDILTKIINKKINTLGKCLLKVKKRKIFVFRENRNLEKIIISNKRPLNNELFFARHSCRRARKNAAQDRSVLDVHEDPSSGSDEAICEKEPLCGGLNNHYNREEFRGMPPKILWDNRFLIHINPELNDCTVESYSQCNTYGDDSMKDIIFDDINREALFGLPYIHQNHKIGRNIVFSSNDVVFIDGAGLFDIFL